LAASALSLFYSLTHALQLSLRILFSLEQGPGPLFLCLMSYIISLERTWAKKEKEKRIDL
jgi:hypothetical protein